MTIYIQPATATKLAAIRAAGYAAFALLSLVCLATYATPALVIATARRAGAMTTTIRNLSLALLMADATQVTSLCWPTRW